MSIPDEIYLIDMGDSEGVVWCDDPDPGTDMQKEDASKYISEAKHKQAIAKAEEAMRVKCEKLCDEWVSFFRYEDPGAECGAESCAESIRDIGKQDKGEGE